MTTKNPPFGRGLSAGKNPPPAPLGSKGQYPRPSQQQERRPRHKPEALLFLLPLLLPLLFTACGADHEAGEPAPAPVVRAPLAAAERLEVPETVEIYGTVEAEKVAAVSARVMARVTDVRVQTGDTVRRGQVLLTLDPQLSSGQVSQAQGALAQARAALALAERNYERFQALAQTNSASELEVDLARSQYEQARGAVEQAEGAVSSASAVASDTRVTAPFDGRVVQRMVEVGDLAAPGRPLLQLQSGDQRRLAVPVPESVVRRAGLAVGSAVPVTLDTRPDLGTLGGTVAEMSPGANPMSHAYTVKIDLPTETGAGEGARNLATGTAGRAFVPVERRAAVVVPAEALLRQGGLTLVVTRTADGLAATRVVTLGQTFEGGRREVLAGLEGGEALLLGLAAAPPAGARVEEVAP